LAASFLIAVEVFMSPTLALTRWAARHKPLKALGAACSPQRLGGVEVTAAEGAQPMRDGAGVVGRHRSSLRRDGGSMTAGLPQP
jgi:hypothetical protein